MVVKSQQNRIELVTRPDVDQIPKLFFDVERSGPANQALLKVVTDKMKHVLAVVSEQRKYNFLATYGHSLSSQTIPSCIQILVSSSKTKQSKIGFSWKASL